METIGKGPDRSRNDGEKRSRIHLLYAVLFGTAIGLVLGLVVGRVGPFFSIAGGIGGFIAGIFLFRRLTEKRAGFNFSSIDGITKEMHDAAVTEGRRKLSKLRASTDRIQDRSIQIKAGNICVLTEKVLDTIEKDPKDLKPARSFLHYYLDTAMNILHRYNDIAGREVRSKDVEAVLRKVDRTLETLEQAFEMQLAKLMENDVMDLDTELTVLEKTIEMEGFGKSSDPQVK